MATVDHAATATGSIASSLTSVATGASSTSIRSAADIEMAVAQYEMARRHCTTGSGLSIDLVEAVRLLKLSSSMDHAEANHALGVALFGGGDGVHAEQKEGLFYLQRAVELGSQYAEYSLGYAHYCRGEYAQVRHSLPCLYLLVLCYVVGLLYIRRSVS
jgi:TPR repeat protein